MQNLDQKWNKIAKYEQCKKRIEIYVRSCPKTVIYFLQDRVIFDLMTELFAYVVHVLGKGFYDSFAYLFTGTQLLQFLEQIDLVEVDDSVVNRNRLQSLFNVRQILKKLFCTNFLYRWRRNNGVYTLFSHGQLALKMRVLFQIFALYLLVEI